MDSKALFEKIFKEFMKDHFKFRDEMLEPSEFPEETYKLDWVDDRYTGFLLAQETVRNLERQLTVAEKHISNFQAYQQELRWMDRRKA